MDIIKNMIKIVLKLILIILVFMCVLPSPLTPYALMVTLPIFIFAAAYCKTKKISMYELIDIIKEY